MKIAIFFFGVVMFVCIGCKHKSTNLNLIPNWTSLIIDEEDHRTVITINQEDDTSDVRFNDYGSFFTGYHKTKTDSLKTYFTLTEKDTIVSLIENIISNPVEAKRACTDFVGDIELTIYYGRFKAPGSYKQSIAYSGICRWDTLSMETRQLNAMLTRKIKLKNK